jgi:hypothetical protein
MSETQFKFKNLITVKLTKPEEDEIDNLLQEALPDYDFEKMDNKPMDAEYFKLYDDSKKNLPKELEYV